MDNDYENVSLEEHSDYGKKSPNVVQCKYCGKEYNKSGIRLHEKYCQTAKQSTQDRQEQSTSSTPKTDRQEIAVGKYSSSTPKQSTSNKYQEISMKEQYDEKKGQIEPKKEEKTEHEFECGACHAQFSKRHKFCPECGVGFE